MARDDRSILIARLHADLLGPATSDEVLVDRPSDRYLTGILYPRRLEFSAAEDEKLANSVDGSIEEAGGGDEDIAPSALHKPSAAGVSFCVSAKPEETLSLVVRLRCGTYARRERRQEDREPNPEGSSADPLVARAASKSRIEWSRTHHEFDVALSLTLASKPDVPLDEFGLTDCALYVTQAPIDGGRMVTIRLVNQNEWTPGAAESKRPDEMSLFQTHFDVSAVAPARLIARPIADTTGDTDSRMTALLYRHVKEYAIGHTCSATWNGQEGDTVESVSMSWIPEQSVRMVTAEGAPILRDYVQRAHKATGKDPLSASTLSGADGHLELLLSSVPDGYAAWIKLREDEAKSLTGDLRLQADLHLDSCRRALSRMRTGVQLILSDNQIRSAFELMNQAMQMQRVWTERVRAKGMVESTDSLPKGLRWYPFQLAFILQCIESSAKKKSTDRDIMDLLWFPTGGGKTEAYLGLIAFTAFLRRLRRAKEPDRGGGVSCIMRYTLRLLTLQQFQRASTLILACEYLRRGFERPSNGVDLTKTAPFSVGLWVGGDATPNKVVDAIAALSNPFAPNSPKQLTSCPCCGGALTWQPNETETDILVSCRSTACVLAKAVPTFPLQTVDELIYRTPPTLLFATVDKFAQIVRSSSTRALFNAGVAPPPELIIQDELHLISGPLGTLTAIYETAVDLICSRDGHPPKVIGSTATIRRADEQILALFNRRAAQFPPPGLDIGDSCFAYVEPDALDRRYLGITTAGRSAKFTLQAVYASLLQGASSIGDATARDGYHTLVGYFNALRELGGAVVLVQDDVGASVRLLAERHVEPPREAREILELTSRVSQQDIRGILDRMELRCDQDGAVDVLLASNMISVGVDVSRLALMVVMGQPKGISEYIQATSRVGRDQRAPGLVVTVLNAMKARDRAHFESFISVHQALYRGVEATSVTPFAARARDRALHAAVVAAVRHLISSLAEKPDLDATNTEDVRRIIERIAMRAVIDPQELEATKGDLAQILQLWQQRAPAITTYWNDEQENKSLLMSAERAAARNRSGLSGSRAWPTLNSMRTVEAATPFRLVEKLRDGEPV